MLRSVVGLELTRIGNIVQAKQNCGPAIPLVHMQQTEMFTYVPKDKDQNVHCSQSGNY